MKAAAIAPDAKTYALLIGISKYQKLPQDLWLQYAACRREDVRAASAECARRRSAGGADAGADE